MRPFLGKWTKEKGNTGPFWRAWRAWRGFSQAFALLLLSLTVAQACVQKKPEPEASAFEFPGVNRIESLSNGIWRVVWQPITAVTDVTYLVFQRDEKGRYDESVPVARTREHAFLTGDLRFLGSQCFMIKALVGDEILESSQTKDICTNHTPFEFQGISSITPLDSDGYVLSWSAVGFGTRELSFELRRREKDSENWVLVGGTSDNYFVVRSTPAQPIDTSKNYCFRVNFIHEKVKDTNTREVCTDSAIAFDGIASAKFLPPDVAEITWALPASERSKVSMFRVYRVQGRERRSLLSEVRNATPDANGVYRLRLPGVSLESRFDLSVKAVSRSVGLEDANARVLNLYSANSAPKTVVFDANKTGCSALAAAEAAGQDPGTVFGINAAKDLKSKCHVKIEASTRVDANGRTVPDQITCSASFTDPDATQLRIRPRFYFRARLPGAERPVVLRKVDAKGFVTLNPTTRVATAQSSYTIDPAVDKRGADIFCEVVVNDTLVDSEAVTSEIVFLPDSPPLSTGIFISKQRRFVNATVGSSHYYPAPDGEPGNPGDTCLVPQGAGFVQNPDTRDICEDTTVEILIKASNVPDTLLQPGKEQEFDQFLGEVDYSRKDLGVDYTAFYANANNRFRLGYIDPDPGDKASRIEIDPASVRNGTVLGSSCLEGACTITFRLKKDYNSGHIYGDRDADGNLVPHAEFKYRIRTNEPSTEEGVDAFGTPLSEVGWTKWAKAQIEVTAVDEEPIATGITVAAVEDRVQKIVICEDFNDTDPECSEGKTLSPDPNTATSGLRYLSGRGKGYFDLEADPVVKVLPRTTLDPAKAAWVKPAAGVANPDPTIPSHWTTLAGADVTDESKDQTAGYYPFQCDKVARKCVGFVRPAANANSDTMGVLNVPYDLWVEVDTASNPDPSYVGRPLSERLRKSASAANISLDFTPVNDSPRIADVTESFWQEDDNASHELVVIPSAVSPPAVVDAAGGTWWDPDGDKIRDNTDVEVRFVDGDGSTKTSYCRGPDETLTRTVADVPGTTVSTRCRVKVGSISYFTQPNMGNLATSGPLYNLPTQTTADLNVEWQCNEFTGCVARFLYPLNAHGNNVFEYRVRSTRLNGAAKEYRPEDWSDWKRIDVSVNPVPDAPLSTSVTMTNISSDSTPIKEDEPFTIRLVRANGNGATNLLATDLGPSGAAVGAPQRLYHAYFDVDETDDIAVSVIVTSVAQIGGVPVVRKTDGSPIAANDASLFTCDTYGLCEATLLSAPDLNTRSGGDPFFSYQVVTAPKSDPTDVNKRLTSGISQVSFAIVATDDAPSAGGAGGGELALNEDVNNEVVVRFNGGAGSQLSYTDPDAGDFGEKIEIAEVTVFDPDPVATLTGGYGWPEPVPPQVLRTGDEQKGWVLGEWRFSPTDKNTSYVMTTTAETTSASPRWRPADGTLPERFQYTCRARSEGTLNQGDCRLIVRGPKDFNTRLSSTRAMSFKWRVFARWQGDGLAWDPTDETNGAWTPWTTALVGLQPVNDPPVIVANLNNALLGGSESTTGTNSATNRVIVTEDEWSNITFNWKDVYDSVESTTAAYTYKNDLATGTCTGAALENPFFCMLYKIDWLATKFSAAITQMATQFYDNPSYPTPDPSPLPLMLGTPNPNEIIASPQTKSQLSSWMGTAWTEGTAGQFWGAPVPSASANLNTNVNCKPNGECVLRMKPPPDFFGKTTLSLKFADGKTSPADADWSLAARDLHIQVKNVDDLPGALPMVVDLFEDQAASITFGRIAPHRNACTDGYNQIVGQFALPCTEGSFSTAPDNPNLPFPHVYGRDVGGIRYGVCQQRLTDNCPGQTYQASLHSMFDADRERPTQVEIRSATNVTVTPRASMGSYASPAFSLGFAPNFFNTASTNTTGRPYTYVGDPALGNAFFEYRVKTKQDEHCAGANDCWSNWATVHTRVHPVNDGLRLNPGAASIPCTVNRNGAAANCVQEITVPEDTKFSITIPNTLYYDPDSAQMPGRNAKYARAVGISQCFSREFGSDGSGGFEAVNRPLLNNDNAAFRWSPALTYQTVYEDNFANGRTDGLVDTASVLRIGTMSNMQRSTGNLVLAGGVPQSGYGQNGSGITEDPFQRGTSNQATITGIPGVTLTTNCPLDASNWPTGECTMEVMPMPNVTGSFALCVQLTDAVGPGEFYAARPGDNRWNFGQLSEPIFIKVNVVNAPDVPRIAQMPVRGRANEDHDAIFEIGGRDPKVQAQFEAGAGGGDFSGGGASGYLKFDDEAAVVRPGYFDFDGSKAKSLHINMASIGATFSGIKGGSIRFNADPAATTYTSVCQSGLPANNICDIPCDTEGWCRFKISPPSDKGQERITLQYWVKTEEPEIPGLLLSSRQIDNTVAGNGGNAAFAPFDNLNQYTNSNFKCTPQGAYEWDEWRTQFEEDHSVTGIPGLFWDALHPILTPTYPQLSPPPLSRLVPNLAGLGRTANRLLALKPNGKPIKWNGDPSPKPGAENTIVYNEADGTSLLNAQGVDCSDMSTGRIVADFMEVPDRPATQNVSRALLEDVPAQMVYVGSNASDPAQNGYSDGDGDGPNRLVFHTNLPASVGTLSLSATPPATPEGMGSGLLTDGDGRKYVPLAANLGASGCQTANRRCVFYFHPAPNYAGSYSLNYSVVTGADNWASDPTALGSLQLNVAGTNDVPVIQWAQNVPDLLSGGLAPTPSTYEFNVFEGGGPDENSQVVTLSVTSSQPSVLAASIRNASDTGDWSDPGIAASAPALLRLSPQSFAGGASVITVTATDSAGATTTWTHTVTVNNPNQKPGIVFDTFGTGPYVVDEDTGIPQEMRIPSGPNAGLPAEIQVDEGSGDVPEQQVAVSFTSSNILVIPHANITFSRTDTAGASDMGAATGRILIRPVGDMVTTTTPVTITMTVTETNVTPPLSETYEFTVHVTPVNDAPTISSNVTSGSPYTTTEDTPLTFAATLDEGGGADEDAQTLAVSFSGYDGALIQSVTFSRTDNASTNMGAAAGTIEVTPQPNAHGTTTVTLEVNDGEGGTASQNFTVTFTPVNDEPRLVSGIPATASTNEDTPLVLSSVVLDEGGAASGSFNEDADVLTFSVSSSNTALVPNGNIVLDPSTDDASDASAVVRTLTITPVANQSGSTTITVRASDGTHTNVTVATLALTVNPMPDAPVGTVACTPTNSAGLAAGNYMYKAGTSLAAKGIVCSGISDADGDTVSYSVSGTCSAGGITINASTGALGGTMPGSACSLVVSATAGGDEIEAGQKATLSFAPGEISTASLSGISLAADTSCTVSGTTLATYSGGAAFASAVASATTAGMGSFAATATTWSGVLQDFAPAGYTLRWTVESTAGDSMQADKAIALDKTALGLVASAPVATLGNAAAPGHQPSFNFPTDSCSSQSQCATQARAVVAAGFDHSCAVGSNGALQCWGNNANNKLGIAAGASYSKAQAVSGLTGVRSVALGEAHGCAVNSSGALFCWGDNTHGQLGTGNNSPASTPVAVPSLSSGVAAVVAGSFHTCALRTNGEVACFGRNNTGQLGDGTTTNSNSPVIPIAAHAKALTAAGLHTCAFTDNGAGATDVKCWGDNTTDQLGVGNTTAYSHTPMGVNALPAPDLPNVRALAAGGGEVTGTGFGHTCALLSNGRAHCWGANGHGQLGSGSTGGPTNGAGTGITPLEALATPLENIASLSAGERFTCALKTNRTVACWGQNANGQFGNASDVDSSYATPALGGAQALALSSGKAHSCAVLWGGGVQCAGEGMLGKLGNNTTAQSTVPVSVLNEAESALGGQWRRCEAIAVSEP